MDTNTKIDALIGNAIKTYKVTGASVSIVSDNEFVHVRNFGFSDLRNRIPVNDNTVFKIGSITKVFTASAVMQLVEKGKIDIDYPVKKYIPEFSVRSRYRSDDPITIRDILCHHSGLPCDNLKDYFAEDPYAFHSVIKYLQNAWLVYPPKKMFYYSNLGYELLGVLVSRVSGMPFHEYIESVLLKGCGMTSSGIILSDEQRKNLSLPYRKGKEQFERMMKGIPEGGIHSTSYDMGLFMKSIIEGAPGLFTENKTLVSMLMPQYPGNVSDMDIVNGLAWFIGKPGINYAGKVIWHDGGTPNFFSLIVIIPERRLGITLLTNSATGAIMNHKLSIEILQILLKERQGISPRQDKSKLIKNLPYDKAIKLTGSFFTTSGITTIDIKCNRLIAAMPTGKVLLHACDDGWFKLKLLLLGVIPLKMKTLSMLRIGIKEIDGEKVLALEQLGLKSLYGRLCRPINSTAFWEQKAGNYVCVNEAAPRLKTLQLRVDKEGIKLSAKTDKMGQLNMYLDIKNDFEAVTQGYGRYAGETITVSERGIMLFGLEFQKMP